MSSTNEFYLLYKNSLESLLVEICTSKGLLSGQLICNNELNQQWEEMAKEYVADAIAEIGKYPTVAIAWAGYLGLGVATMYINNPEQFKSNKNLYKTIVSPRGFDSMDEYILEDILNLPPNSKETELLENLMLSLSQKALSIMRKENIIPQSSEAFYIFTHSVEIFYQIGVSLVLEKKGLLYK